MTDCDLNIVHSNDINFPSAINIKFDTYKNNNLFEQWLFAKIKLNCDKILDVVIKEIPNWRYDIVSVMDDALKWSGLNHDHLLKFLAMGRNTVIMKELGFEDHKLLLIYEYVDSSLFTIKEKVNLWNLRTKLNVLLQIASGIEYLHKQALVHGHIQPDNICINFIDQNIDVKLFDFSDRKTNCIKFYQNNCILNHYEAPEQFLCDNNKIDHRSDIYSFGGIIFYLFSGHDPWHSKCCNTIGRQSRDNFVRKGMTPLHISPNINNIPIYLFDFMEKCFNVDMQKRPTLSDIITWLKSVLANNDEYIESLIDNIILKQRMNNMEISSNFCVII